MGGAENERGSQVKRLRRSTVNQRGVEGVYLTFEWNERILYSYVK